MSSLYRFSFTGANFSLIAVFVRYLEVIVILYGPIVAEIIVNLLMRNVEVDVLWPTWSVCPRATKGGEKIHLSIYKYWFRFCLDKT